MVEDDENPEKTPPKLFILLSSNPLDDDDDDNYSPPKKRKIRKTSIPKKKKQLSIMDLKLVSRKNKEVNNIEDLIEIIENAFIDLLKKRNEPSSSTSKEKRKRENSDVQGIKEFIKALKDLNKMIGMKSIKDQILNQILLCVQKINDPEMFLHTALIGGPGCGKCHGKGQKVLMYDGSLKKVEDVKVDDRIMGSDSTPRKVISTTKGSSELFKITQSSGDHYTVNKDHVLSLVHLSTSNRMILNKEYEIGDVINISVENYLKLSDYEKETLYGYKKKPNFPATSVNVDAYLMGYVVSEALQSNAKKNYIVPREYLYNSENVRLKFLAGVIDKIGNVNSKFNYYIIIKNPGLKKYILYLIKTLLFNTTVSIIKSKKNEIFYSIEIKGNLKIIPVKNEVYKLMVRKSQSTYSRIKITSIGNGEYYGFAVDKNRLYMLEDCTITHNSTLCGILAKLYMHMGVVSKGNLVIANRSDLVGQWLGETSIKTKKILESALGGVILIDETYSLGNSEGRDSFSKECIDCINQYLSEHKDIVCIIAGYENELNNCFFKHNPGLDRRFPWKYHIETYTPKELYNIFIRQLEKSGWRTELTEEDFLEKIFKKDTKHYFTNNGGDTKNFLDKCKIQHARRIFGKQALSKKKKCLTEEDIIKGFNIYKKEYSISNRLSKPPEGLYT